VQTEYRRGIYRGIGEFHVFGKSAAGEWVKKIVDFSVEYDLYLHAHCDEEALLILFGHNPRAKIIWAHTGFTTPPARIAELFAQYPALWAELSYHSGIVGGAGQLTPAWRDLFGRYSERFLIGSDTWIDQRWTQYDDLMRGYRAWLAQLPADQARNVAHANAERLFGGKVGE
jgi:predicted TIM-barrel fold metal-dependent hydrolase